jgi:hypothetical protein
LLKPCGARPERSRENAKLRIGQVSDKMRIFQELIDEKETGHSRYPMDMPRNAASTG